MNYTFSKATNGLKSSAVREILKLTQGKSIISFAGGLPAEEFFPIDAMREAMNRVFDQSKQSLQYGLTEGYIPLRQKICERMAAKGVNITIDNMLMTTGSQQSIDLLARIYLDPGDVVLVENPTYLAALQVFHSYQVRTIAVDGDEHGMDMNDLERKIKQYKPKMVYVIPTFTNPTGRVWSIERRKALISMCKPNHVLIMEDDPYGEIQFDSDERYPSIFSLDSHPDDCAVIYTSTFSKTVAPAVRTGWVIGDKRVIQQMTRAKQAADLHSSTIDQQALYQLLSHFDIDAHIAIIRKEYKQRMKLMAELMAQHSFPGVTWNEPKGGMFFWVTLPEGWKAEELLKKAVDEGVAFVPGSVFFAETPQFNTMRMNFTHTDRDNMILGMQRLSAAIQSYTAVTQ